MNFKKDFEEHCGCPDHDLRSLSPHVNVKTILKRILLIIEDQEAKEVTPRLVLYLNHFLDLSKDGIYLTEAKLVGVILEFLCLQCRIEYDLSICLYKLIMICKSPLKFRQNSEKLIAVEYISSILSSIGNCLIYANNHNLRLHLIDILQTWFNRRPFGNEREVNLSLCVSSLKSSHLLERLYDLLKMCPENLYCELLGILYKILTLSEEMRKLMFDWGLLEDILLRIYLDEVKNMKEVYTLELSSNLLWHLLLSTSRENMSHSATISMEGFKILQKWLSMEVHHSINSTARDDVAMIICQICYLYKSLNNFFLCGLYDDIVELISPMENDSSTVSRKGYCEFQKILLTIVCLGMNHYPAKWILKKHDFMERLTLMTDPNHLKVQGCCNDEAWEMSHFIIQFLPYFAEHQRKVFNRSQWDSILYDYLKLFLSDQLSLDSLKSTLKCIYLLSLLLELTTCFISNDFTEMFNDLLTHLAHSERYSLAVQMCMKYIVLTITKLLECHSTVMGNVEHDGIDAAMTILKRFQEPQLEDSIADQELLMALGDFLWEWIRNSKKKHYYFIANGGVFLVLDYVQKSISPVQLVFCRLLVDLIDIETAILQVVAWRGENRETIVNLMCSLWKKQEQDKGVKRDENGCLIDVESPLSGSLPSNSQGHNNSFDTCPPILDMYACLLPKLFAVRSLLFCRYPHIAEMTESVYNVPYKDVTLEDEITLQLIESYYTLKQGEIWWNMWNAFNTYDPSPLPMDTTVLTTLAKTFLQSAHNLKKKQKKLFKELQKKLIENEKCFYSKLQFSSLPKALEALRRIRISVITTKKSEYNALVSTTRLADNRGNSGFITMTVGRKPLMEYMGD